jgi:hypothetical protein
VRGRWGGLRAPDNAVEDLRGHEGAVEEGCVGHCGRFWWFGRLGYVLVRIECRQIHAGMFEESRDVIFGRVPMTDMSPIRTKPLSLQPYNNGR